MRGVALDISGFSAGTITFTESDTPSTSVASAALAALGGGTDNNEATFQIPSGFTVGDDEYHDYISQIELTGAGIRGSLILTVRVLKKLGDAT